MCALCGDLAEPAAQFCPSCAAPIERGSEDDALQVGVVRTSTGGYYRPSSALLLDPPMSPPTAPSHPAINKIVTIRLAVGLCVGLAVGGIALIRIASVL
jgi:hypothetical protein